MNEQKKVLLKFEAGGKTLVAGTNLSEYSLFGLEGLSGLEFDFTTSSGPQTSNTVILNRKPLPRQVCFGLRFDGDKRSFVAGFFNPYEKGKLTIEMNGVSRFINYFALPVKMEQDNVYKRVTANVELFCPEPYWLDSDDFGKDIGGRSYLLAFPFAVRNKKVAADYRVFSTEVPINNSGDVPVPVHITFRALGHVKNPCLTLNEGPFVRAELDMVKGDALEFSTDTDDLYARLNGEDILNRTDPDMSFFQIPKGKNVITYSAEDGTANLKVFVYFRSQFLGI